MTTINQLFFGDQAGVPAHYVSRGKRPSGNLFGIEVELENFHAVPAVLSDAQGQVIWNVTNDGSLRNNGKEFVSVPLPESELATAVNALFGFLQTTHFDANARGGTHVHVNCLTKSTKQLRMFLASYIAFERVLYLLSGERDDNYFCVPLTRSVLERHVGEALKLNDGESLRNLSARCNKYSGLNLRTLRDRGTLEFRQHKAVGSAQELMDWVTALVNLDKLSMELSNYRDLTEINTTSQYEVWIIKLIGIDRFNEVSAKHPEIAKLLRAGVRDLKLMLA